MVELDVDPARLKVGDICYLNSGSPRMTVTGLLEATSGLHISVAWVHYDSGELRRDSLPAAALRKA